MLGILGKKRGKMLELQRSCRIGAFPRLRSMWQRPTGRSARGLFPNLWTVSAFWIGHLKIFLLFFLCVCVLLTRFPFSMLFVCSDGDEGSPFHMAKFGLFPSLILRIYGLFGSLELGGVLELENSSRVCVLVCARHLSNSFR